MDTSPFSALSALPTWMQALLLWLHGGSFIAILIILIPIDFLSGVMVAIVNKKVNSTIAWRGVMKKCMTGMLVGLSAALEPITHGIPITNMVCMAFIAAESLSVLENAAALGVPIPLSLLEVLEKLRESKATRLATPQDIAAVVAAQQAPAVVQVTVAPAQPLSPGVSQSEKPNTNENQAH